jgi:hypothetical protein
MADRTTMAQHHEQVLHDQEPQRDLAMQAPISCLSDSSLTMMIVDENVSATAM